MAPSPKRWLVLATFAFTSAFNAFFYMNFASISKISKKKLGCPAAALEDDDTPTTCTGISDVELNFATYSIGLLCVLPIAPLMAKYLNSHNYAASLVGVCLNVMGAWVRYAAMDGGNLALTTLSTALIGGASAMVICTYSLLAERWFPPEERTFATTCGVQSNYFGWLLGAVITPRVVSHVDDLDGFFLWQAIAATLALPLFLAFHRARPPPDDQSAEYGGGNDQAAALPDDEHDAAMPAKEIAARLFGDRQVWLQVFAFSLMGGISFAIPAISDEVYDHPGALSGDQTSWLNFSFILCGVAGGLTLGKLIKHESQFFPVLRKLFWGSSAATLLLVVVFYARDSMSNGLFFALNLALMAVAGFTELGFIGLGLQVICRHAHPIAHTYSSGLVEWWIQVFGAVLPLAIGSMEGGGGIILCCVMSVLATVAFQLLGREPDGTSHTAALLSAHETY